MSSLLWEDPREEPGSNLRRRRPGNVYVGSVKPTDRGQQRRPKKVGGTRTWLRVDCTGGSELVDMGKQSIMRMTGLSARDLRILDPILSYPSCITGREGAIVVNLENIKGIITAHNFWLLNPKDPVVLPFITELEKRARDRYETNNPKMDMDETNYGVEEGKNKLKNLPFEFVALETCLETVCNCLDDEAGSMEVEAYPALDKLTSSISRRKLDRVRQIKGRLVALCARVHKVRDLIEHLLEDSADMSEMYLTKKLLQNGGSSCVSSLADDEEERDEQEQEDDENREMQVMGRVKSSRISIVSGMSLSNKQNHAEVGELEMILEAYFVQAEGALNKLSTLKEYVDNTEDYVNIMLDDKQNNLLKMGIMITTATLMTTFVILVAGIFGMNVHISLFEPPNPTINNWLYTALGSIGSATFMYIVIISWYKYKRLV